MGTFVPLFFEVDVLLDGLLELFEDEGVGESGAAGVCGLEVVLVGAGLLDGSVEGDTVAGWGGRY